MVDGGGFGKRGGTVRMMMVVLGQKGPLIRGGGRRSRRGNRVIVDLNSRGLN